MDDESDLSPWLYTAVLTGDGGAGGDARAWAVEVFNRLISTDSDELDLEGIDEASARVRDWMKRRPNSVQYCFELDAIHEDLGWMLSELRNDVEARFSDRPDLMRTSAVYHVHNYHYRVHAYREKVAQLLNACLEPPLDERKVRAQDVLQKLGAKPELQELYVLLSELMRRVDHVVERRNSLAHRRLLSYESAGHSWRIVTAWQRARDYFDIAASNREVEFFANLFNFVRQESEEIREVVSFLDGFRVELVRSLRRLALTAST